MELEAVIIILIIAIIIFISFYMITLYNRIILSYNITLKKFEPIDISIKKYIDISDKLKEIVKEDNLCEELSILSNKLSKVKNNNRKILVLKDADFTINKVFKIYNNNKKVNKLKEEYNEYHNKILYAKDIYNKKVFEYNKQLNEFPYIITTKLLNIKKIDTIDGE